MRGDRSVPRERRVVAGLTGLFSGYRGPGFSVRLWNGWEWSYAQNGVRECTLVVNSADALALLATGADEASVGAAYIRKELDVEGNLYSVFPVVEYLMHRPRAMLNKATEVMLNSTVGLKRWLRHGVQHSKERDEASIAYHYDLPVEFYRPWLGETLAYSCAYFRSPNDCLDQAQTQKLELICKKLRLREGERFLDVGCGWGSLVLHAASRHHVLSHGITLSREQAAVANRRIAAGGLDRCCKVEFRDYRNCGDLSQSFDKIASIGMYEHVGLPNLPLYFATVYSLLKPGGALLNHGIARSPSSPARANSFIDRYVFPDGKLVTITQAINAAESAGFEVRDIENLRDHYVLTLRKWVEGLKQNKDALLQIVPESTYRIWLLYTAGSAAAFRRGDIAIHQVLLSRLDHGCSRLPLVREDWYRGQAALAATADGGRTAI